MALLTHNVAVAATNSELGKLINSFITSDTAALRDRLPESQHELTRDVSKVLAEAKDETINRLHVLARALAGILRLKPITDPKILKNDLKGDTRLNKFFQQMIDACLDEDIHKLDSRLLSAVRDIFQKKHFIVYGDKIVWREKPADIGYFIRIELDPNSEKDIDFNIILESDSGTDKVIHFDLSEQNRAFVQALRELLRKPDSDAIFGINDAKRFRYLRSLDSGSRPRR